MISSVLIAAGAAILAPASYAATTWQFSSGSIALPDSFSSATADFHFTNLEIADGTITSGSFGISSTHGAAIFCTTRSYSGNTVTFSDGGYAGCTGNMTLSVDPQGRLTVTSQDLHNSTFLFQGSATSGTPGTQPTPTVVTLAPCELVLDYANQLATVSLTQGNADAADYSVSFPGTAFPPTPFTKADLPFELQLPFSLLTMGSPLTAHIDATRSFDGKTVAACDTNSVTPLLPGAPRIDGDVVAPQGGSTATINYSVGNPAAVQGIEYQLDGRGAWLRPGGSAPTSGAGGSFSISGLTAGKHSVQVRAVGYGTAPTIVEGALTYFTTGTPGKPGSNAVRPSQSTAIGSSPAKPVSAPPVQPVSTVPGTSNGAGTGTNGALAANTGNAGIDAPCLAKDGTLYPNQYSTVGSQLTMAPNTHGMGAARSFIVTAGSLPPGVQLDRAYGVLYGVTSAVGSWVTTVQATFADGTTKSSQFTTRVDADPQSLQYAAQNIGVVGSRVAIAPSTNAPVTGTTYTLVCGELPAGTKFDSRTGVITGTPTAQVLLPTPLRVAETSATGKAAASFLFVVQKSGFTAIHYPAHPHLRVGHTARIRPTVNGVGEIALFRMWKGKLQRGLRLNPVTGVVSGKPRYAGPTHTITIVAVTKGGALLTAAPMRISTRR
ncbi:MAG: hypothetical protein RL205_657 [Actinomycetota bacterium]|jgi:hypothetical protein